MPQTETQDCHESDAQRALCAVRNLTLPLPAAEAVYRLTTDVAQPCPALAEARTARLRAADQMVREACEALEAERDAHERTTALLHETERRLDEYAHPRRDLDALTDLLVWCEKAEAQHETSDATAATQWRRRASALRDMLDPWDAALAATEPTP